MGVLGFFWRFFRILFLPKAQLAAENIVLRQQLAVLHRRSPARPQIKPSDRLLLSWICRFHSTSLFAILIVKPETVIRWHRTGFKRYWRWKSLRRYGRPRTDRELRGLIRRISRENPLWGAPRIHGELRMLGIRVAQSTVAKYMIRRRGPPSATWRAFLKEQADGIAALDLFTVPTIRFDVLYALVILAHGNRRILHTAVTRHPTSEWIARQIIEAFPWNDTCQYMLRDNDAVYGNRYKEQLKAMDIRDIRTAFRSPWQNAYAERLIGSIRRDCLDHTIIWNANHLRQTLKAYTNYYNSDRTHLSLGKNTPLGRKAQENTGRITSIAKVNGLHHRYERVDSSGD